MLTSCGAPELPESPNYLDQMIWNFICGTKYTETALQHLTVTFLRRSDAAQKSYVLARSHLQKYVDGLSKDTHLGLYWSALMQFEHCIAATWQAIELYREMSLVLVGNREKVFTPGDGSDLESINHLNNVLKHFSFDQAKKSSTPMWITNDGLASVEKSVSFVDLQLNVISLSEMARTMAIELPHQARERARNKLIGHP